MQHIWGSCLSYSKGKIMRNGVGGCVKAVENMATQSPWVEVTTEQELSSEKVSESPRVGHSL
jgi:hypothetical protein